MFTGQRTASQHPPLRNDLVVVAREVFSVCDRTSRRGAPKTLELEWRVGSLVVNFGIKLFSEKSFRNEKKQYVRARFATAALSPDQPVLVVLCEEGKERELAMVNHGRFPMTKKHPLFAIAATKRYEVTILSVPEYLPTSLVRVDCCRDLEVRGFSVETVSRTPETYMPIVPGSLARDPAPSVVVNNKASVKAAKAGKNPKQPRQHVKETKLDPLGRAKKTKKAQRPPVMPLSMPLALVGAPAGLSLPAFGPPPRQPSIVPPPVVIPPRPVLPVLSLPTPVSSPLPPLMEQLEGGPLPSALAPLPFTNSLDLSSFEWSSQPDFGLCGLSSSSSSSMLSGGGFPGPSLRTPHLLLNFGPIELPVSLDFPQHPPPPYSAEDGGLSALLEAQRYGVGDEQPERCCEDGSCWLHGANEDSLSASPADCKFDNNPLYDFTGCKAEPHSAADNVFSFLT